MLTDRIRYRADGTRVTVIGTESNKLNDDTRYALTCVALYPELAKLIPKHTIINIIDFWELTVGIVKDPGHESLIEMFHVAVNYRNRKIEP